MPNRFCNFQAIHIYVPVDKIYIASLAKIQLVIAEFCLQEIVKLYLTLPNTLALFSIISECSSGQLLYNIWHNLFSLLKCLQCFNRVKLKLISSTSHTHNGFSWKRRRLRTGHTFRVHLQANSCGLKGVGD